jgi:hypothetical protein
VVQLSKDTNNTTRHKATSKRHLMMITSREKSIAKSK